MDDGPRAAGSPSAADSALSARPAGRPVQPAVRIPAKHVTGPVLPIGPNATGPTLSTLLTGTTLLSITGDDKDRTPHDSLRSDVDRSAIGTRRPRSSGHALRALLSLRFADCDSQTVRPPMRQPHRYSLLSAAPAATVVSWRTLGRASCNRVRSRSKIMR
jgi:hypothetical protein